MTANSSTNTTPGIASSACAIPGSGTFDQNGALVSGSLGSVAVQNADDGLGRMIQRQQPSHEVTGEMRTEHYYYDGVRRIHEVVEAPVDYEIPDDEPLITRDLQFNQLVLTRITGLEVRVQRFEIPTKLREAAIRQIIQIEDTPTMFPDPVGGSTRRPREIECPLGR